MSIFPNERWTDGKGGGHERCRKPDIILSLKVDDVTVAIVVAVAVIVVVVVVVDIDATRARAS